MKLIHDSVHGTIKLEEWMVELIDTPQFQRLRRIKQLGFADLVYPGAHHTRFEHSIGVMHVASKLTTDPHILAAALLHDIGHTPFSHSGEIILKKYMRREHEDVRDIIGKSEIGDILDRHGIDWRRVAEEVARPPVSSVIDVDRIDYLLRDAHYTGVAYGVVDFDRLVEKMHFDGSRVFVDAGGVRAVESFLISRYLMYSAVYHHHVCRIARKMFERAMEWMIEEGMVEPGDLARMDDYDVTWLMRSSEGLAGEIASRLSTRRLFKRAIYSPRGDVGVNVERVDSAKAAREIAEDAGVEDGHVIVDIPPLESSEYDVPVLVDGEFVSIAKLSPLVIALKNAQVANWRLGVYCPEEHVEKVRRAAVDYFDIKTSKQKKLSELFEF
ncbi:MAG: HD domain-containing protein [Archaeoglobi archaeon]|nr:HD domain-containing protein [Archaeoglobi archaeon]